MPSKYPKLFEDLAAEFHPSEVRTRNDGRREFLYITARTVMNRLDAVLGPENWTARYERWSDFAIQCHLTITLEDGQQVTKSDLGSYSTMAEKNKAGAVDPGDDDKGGASDALKRAAVQLGIGRYLYDSTPAPAANGHGSGGHNGNGRSQAPRQDNGYNSGRNSQQSGARNGSRYGSNGNGHQNPGRQRAPQRQDDERDRPVTGGQLFAWCKQQSQRLNLEWDLVGELGRWGQEQGMPERIVDWGRGEVADGYVEGCRLLQEADR